MPVAINQPSFLAGMSFTAYKSPSSAEGGAYISERKQVQRGELSTLARTADKQNSGLSSYLVGVVRAYELG